MTLSKHQERKLNELERKYDRDALPTRTFYTDRKTIEDLVKDGAIDHEHGLHLLDQAKVHYQATEKARKDKRAKAKASAHIDAVEASIAAVGSYGGPSILEANQMITHGLSTIVGGIGTAMLIALLAFMVL